MVATLTTMVHFLSAASELSTTSTPSIVFAPISRRLPALLQTVSVPVFATAFITRAPIIIEFF